MRGKRPRLTRRTERWYRQILAGWQGLNYGFSWRGVQLGWAALGFAKRWHGRDIDLARLQNIVLRSDCAELCYRYAKEVPGAAVRKHQRQVVRFGTAELMRRFAREVPGADREYLDGMADIADIMLG